MSISVKIDKKFRDFNKEFIQVGIKRFYAQIAVEMPYVIVGQIQKGISPVEKFGRFKPYSQSYVDQIEGKVKFFWMNGHAVPIKPKTDVVRKELYGKQANKKGLFKQGSHSKISFKTRLFQKGLGQGKLKSPVNLSVTGVMLGTLNATVNENHVELKFNSPIAKYHNEGTNKIPRRPLLPKDGEEFSSLIMKKLRDILSNSLKT
jgi:hypothetical protein